MALSRLAFKQIALTVSSALLVFSAISIQAQQEFDTALNKLAPATQSVVKSLSPLDRLPAPQWRTPYCRYGAWRSARTGRLDMGDGPHAGADVARGNVVPGVD